MGSRLLPERLLRDQRTAGTDDPIGQVIVLRRVYTVEVAAHNRDRRCTALHGSPVGDRIDALGQAADYAPPAVREDACQALRRRDSEDRGLACSNHRYQLRASKQTCVPAHINQRRGIREPSQTIWIVLVEEAQEPDIGGCVIRQAGSRPLECVIELSAMAFE
jgi:hypothetical protein